MAIDLSAFQDRMKRLGGSDPKRVDISAFGYEWAEPEAEETPIINPKSKTTFNKPTPTVQTPEEQRAVLERDRANNVRISAPTKEKSRPKSLTSLLKVVLPDELVDTVSGAFKDAIFGSDLDNRFAGKQTGALNFFYGAALKTKEDLYYGRVDKLVKAGYDKERAHEVVEKDMSGEEFYVTPKEEAILKKTKFFETGAALLDSSDFLVPFIGGLAKNTLKLSFKTLAKMDDVAQITTELNRALPKMDADTTASIAKKIAKTTSEDEVAKIVADGVKESAAKMDNATPLVRNVETGEVSKVDAVRRTPVEEVAEATPVTIKYSTEEVPLGKLGKKGGWEKVERSVSGKVVGETDDAVKVEWINNKGTRLEQRLIATIPKADILEDSRKVSRFAPDEVEDLRSLTRRDQTALRETGEMGGEVYGKGGARNLQKEVTELIEKQNKKISDPEVVRLREENLLGPESIDEIIVRKRGIRTDEQVIESAKRMRGTLDDVLNIPKGSTASAEKLTAVRQIVREEEEINNALRGLLNGTNTGSSRAERAAIARLGNEFAELPEGELVLRALQESTLKLKRAQIIEMGLKSEAGRALGTLRRDIEAVDSRMRILFNRINTSKKLTEMEKESMLDLIARLDTTDNATFLKTLDDIVSPDIFDKVAEWSVAAKLWNPTTHVVNLAGNTVRMATDMGITAVTNPMAAKADMAGAVTGLRQGLKNALRALTDDGYAAQLAKYVETGGTAPAISGKLGKWIRTPFRMLGASDEIFKAVGYNRKMYREAYKKAAKEGFRGAELQARMKKILEAPTLKMMEDATEEAKHLTFQDDMGEITQAIDNLRNPATRKTKVGKTFAVIARAFVPFLKTPTNLFKQSIDFSPLGTVKNWKKLNEARKAGDLETIGKVVGESLVGTAIMAYVADQALEGNITGGAPKNKGESDRFYRENKLPYAIKIGDRWYQYKRLDPFATLIGLTADIVNNDAYAEGKYISSTVGVIADNLKDKTYLSGVSDLMNLLSGEDWERDQAINSMLTGAALPSIIGHTARSMDPVIRETDGIVDRFKSQIPVVSETLPAKINVLGYEVERANKGLNYFFNPIQSADAEIDPVTERLLEIDKTISLPNTYFNRGGVKYELSPEEYEEFAGYVGRKLRRGLIDLFKTSEYKNSDDEEKSRLIDNLRTEIQSVWKDRYVERNN